MKYWILFLLLISEFASAQYSKVDLPLRRMEEKAWVDSVYNALTFDERVGQLFMVAAYSNKDSAHIRSVEKLIKQNSLGGLIFFQGGPYRQARLTNHYQSMSKVPLFIGIDAEWGLAMRLDSVNRFPWNMTLGAIDDLKLIERVGVEYGKQSRRLGIHFNFAPVLDINTNPRNPIIGNRSFGEDKYNVTQRALALMKGIQSQGVFATGKHFPGHGDTEVDSHHTLPIVSFSRERIDEIEFYPYKKLFAEGLASVMVAHLNVPSLEPRENYPSSISYNVVTNILQKELKFDGLIFTDALNMKGASNFKQPGDIDLEALLAGNDILLFAENVPWALEKICVAYQDSILTEERLAHSVKKILKYKYKAGLDRYTPINFKNLGRDLNPSVNDALQYTLYENAITVIKNTDSILPIRDLKRERIAYVKLGDDAHSPFLTTLQKYTEVTEVTETNMDSLQAILKNYSTVIIGFHKADGAWKNHEFKAAELKKLDALARNNRVILDLFAKPYSLLPITNFKDIEGIVVSYQNTDVSQVVSAEIIFGAVASKGKLPVTINDAFPLNFGINTKKVDRLGFTAAENVGMNPDILSEIDIIAKKAIDGKMTPGMQILVARHGKVIYQKSFGTHTYDKKMKVTNAHLYDVASLTKIVSTLPHIMQLYDNGTLKMDSKLGEMHPLFSDTNKKNIHLDELLSHQAKLQAWLPFYQYTLDDQKKPDPKYYRQAFEPGFSVQVAENLYLRNDYHDTIMKIIADSKLLPKKEYKYSDFAFIILKDYLERKTKKKIDVLSFDKFFGSIGMNNTMYNPLRKYDMSVIAPTEDDKYFRHQIIQGYVHDMEAAMEGGLGGHAGLFSNAMDIAKMMQMYLQKGSYGGERYFSESTFNQFNTCHFCREGNRRGIGFDKPQLAGKAGSTCGCVSTSSFGHTGFTGTMAWADPETEIVYVFLSNRTFPNAEPNTLSKENIREDIQKIIQRAIIK